MSKTKTWVNCIVHNEENFVWFSIMSIIDFVDKVLVWDTGSTDKTVEIIQEIIKEKGDKVAFKEVGKVDKKGFTKMRQLMLEQSNCDWILVLDGDEVWWEDSIKKAVHCLKSQKSADTIVVPFFNAVGDLYHFQPQAAGKYELLGRKGHLTIRLINKKIPGLHVEGPYGVEGYYDQNNNQLQARDQERMLFIDAPFLHMTHLKRSSRDDHNKYKFELGLRFPPHFQYPEVLKTIPPTIVPYPWNKRSLWYTVISALKFPYHKLLRKI